MTSFSGFKGKGFRFDETEAQLADERKKLQKAALGLHDSDEEDSAVDVSHTYLTDTHRHTVTGHFCVGKCKLIFVIVTQQLTLCSFFESLL